LYDQLTIIPHFNIQCLQVTSQVNKLPANKHMITFLFYPFTIKSKTYNMQFM